MNAKNRLIEQLLRVAKRHKILTYPVLALVSIISILSYFFDWSTGAGKRVVAVIMVMVMLVSQSYFLTSSAETPTDTALIEEETAQEESKGGNSLVEAPDTAQNNADKEDDSDRQEQNTAAESGDTTEAAESVPSGSEAAESDVTNVDNTDVDSATEPVQGEDGQPDIMEDGTDDGIATVDDAAAENGEVEVRFTLSGSNLLTTNCTLDSEGKISAEVFREARDAFNSKVLAEGTGFSGCFDFDGWYYGGKQVNENTTFSNTASIEIIAKAKLTKYLLTVEYMDGGTLYRYNGSIKTDAGVTISSSNDGVFEIPVSSLGAKKTIEILMDSETGYTVGNFTILDGCNSAGVSSIQLLEPRVSVGDSTYLPKVQFTKEAEKYKVQYKLDGEIYISEVSYGAEKLYTASDVNKLIDRIGYTVDNWKIEFNSGYGTKDPGESFGEQWRELLYNDYKKNGDKLSYSIVPNYQPIGIVIGEEDKAHEASYEFEYRVYEDDKIISGYYEGDRSGKGSDKFKYQLTETAPVANLREMGIYITAENGGIHISVDKKGPTDITKGEITVPFSITDGNLEAGDQRPQNFTIKIKIGPKVIRNTDIKETAISKIYDATADYNGEDVKFATTIKGVSLVVPDKTDVKFGGVNAGPQRVTLSNCGLAFDTTVGGSYCDSEHYVLASSTFTTTGTIKKRRVGCKIIIHQPERGYVRAGEKDPDYDIVEDKDLYSGTNTGFLPEDIGTINIRDFVEAYAVDRDDSKLSVEHPTMTCHMGLRETGTVGNYVFGYFNEAGGETTNSDTAFTVRLEEPQGYAITAPGSTGWHNLSTAHELYLTAGASGYDSIQILGDSRTYSGHLVMTEDHIVNNEITFRLYDSHTGAYTSYITEEAKVDLVLPEYLSYTLLADGDFDEGLYFPSEGESVSFGNYFNKTVTFSIRYKDETSGAKYLYYILTNTLGDGHSAATGGNAFHTLFSATDVEGEYVANITVPAGLVDKMGQIILWAE
ncbi:MAG: hypothetical protein K2H34_07470, partial [Lachnospiraceae bacterium]|nr:hypothetical protein [Lachnospiraceae bacterium]